MNAIGSIQHWKSVLLLGLGLCSGLAWGQSSQSTDHVTFTTKAAAGAAQPSSKISTEESASTDTSADAKVPKHLRKPVVLTFDELPGPAWTHAACGTTSSAEVGHGLLTINSPGGDCNEFL